MTTQDDVSYIETLIGYHFENQHWATTAITAAGADELDHHGNRMCARYGRLLIEFYVLDNSHKARVPPSTVNDCTADALRKKRHAQMAREKGIDACMRFSPRQRDLPATDTTLSNAICAIIGAAWKDSHDMLASFKAIESFGLGESKELLAPHSKDAGGANPTEGSSSDQDFSWAIESAAITENPTPLLSPVMEEPRTIPAIMGISLSELTMFSPDPFFHVCPGSDIGTLSAGANFDNSQPPSPSMSSLVLVDTPRETPRLDSAQLPANFDGRTTRTREGSAESLQAIEDHEPTAKIVQHRHARKRKAPKDEHFSKRIKDQQEQAPRGQVEFVQVKMFIKMERAKCAKLNIPYDEGNSMSPVVVKWIASLDKEDERAAVSMIFAGIGSVESVALLQHVLVKSREIDRRTKPGEDLALVDRIREIEQLSGRIACYQFLRRCHIWRLYNDVVHELRSQEPGFVVVTLENISTQKGGRAGNPNNLRVSAITNAMICGMTFEVDGNDSEHQKQRRYYTKLRKLGQRLDLLTTTFGFGVLGLLQTQDPLEAEAVEFGIRISDEMILLPTNKTFNDCVQRLDSAQGDMIRDFSSAVEDVVRSIFDCTRSEARKFPIENIDQVQILRQPKGSAELLKLLLRQPEEHGQNS